MTTAEVADRLVSLCRDGRFLEAVETLYAPEVVSVEAAEFGGMPRELRGREAVKGKNLWWIEHNEVHGTTVTGPFLSPERFAVMYAFDRTNKLTGVRSPLSEVAVYTVDSGKIVHEEFLYAVRQ